MAPYQLEKAFQGSVNEPREQYPLQWGGSMICPPGQSMIFFHKREQAKNEFEARPDTQYPGPLSQGIVEAVECPPEGAARILTTEAVNFHCHDFDFAFGDSCNTSNTLSVVCGGCNDSCKNQRLIYLVHLFIVVHFSLSIWDCSSKACVHKPVFCSLVETILHQFSQIIFQLD